jgi:hypothetical protein
MMVRRLEGRWFVTGEQPGARRTPIAGPFDTRVAAGWWFVERGVGALRSEPAKALWDEVFAAMGHGRADPYHALFVVSAIARGESRKQVWLYATGRKPPADGQTVLPVLEHPLDPTADDDEPRDFRLAAAGDDAP